MIKAFYKAVYQNLICDKINYQWQIEVKAILSLETCPDSARCPSQNTNIPETGQILLGS